MNENVKRKYEEQGYVIIPHLIQDSLFEELCNAAERVIKRTRSGDWPHRRTVGRQFPPYDNSNQPDTHQE